MDLTGPEWAEKGRKAPSRTALHSSPKAAQSELKVEMERLGEEIRDLARSANQKRPASGKGVQRVVNEWCAGGGGTGGAY